MVAIVTACALAACGSGSPSDGGTSDESTDPTGATSDNAAPASTSLVVYTTADQNMLDLIIPPFEAETGIKVDLVTAGTGQLYQRIESEASNPGGDVLFGGSQAQAIDNLQLWEEYVSVNDDAMLPNGRNIAGKLTPFVTNGSVILVNNEKIGEIEVTGYASLLNPELKGRIASGDPASSSSAFNQLTNMLKAMGGDYESDEGWDFVSALVENLDGKVIESSSGVTKGVADGEYPVGLTYESVSVIQVEAGAPVTIVYPEEGTVFLNNSAQIIKGAKNIENAKLFIDYITSQEVQDGLGTQLTSRALREGAATADFVKPFEEILTIEEDVEFVSSHKEEIVARYQQIFLAAN